MAKLTEKQRKFVLYYEGDAQAAAIKAGYSKKTAHVIGHENLNKPNIRKALADKAEQNEAPHIADVTRRKTILTEIAEQTDHKDRVKAVDTLNKMDAVYVQRVKDETDYAGLSEEDMVGGTVEEVLASDTLKALLFKKLADNGYKVIPTT